MTACNIWSTRIFEQMRAGGMDAVQVTVAYHETFAELVQNLAQWNRHFERYPHLIARALSAADIRAAKASGRTAILFGLQTPAPIGDHLGLIQILHQLGVRIKQLRYNNQSLLATGCHEATDPGLTRFGRQAVAEMNRVGLVIYMSHSAERSTLRAIDLSARPITLSHANPNGWHPARRNKSGAVLTALTAPGGMLGLSLYPHHLQGGSTCALDSFCQMAAEAASRYGAGNIGIGSDLCQDQPDKVVDWMRMGRWTRTPECGEGSAPAPGFPASVAWFADSRDFAQIGDGLSRAGFSAAEVEGVMGENWLRFYEGGFGVG